jgi:hypothetical protein
MSERMFVCRFETTEGISKLDYVAVKEAVVKAGRYSVFEATASAMAAKCFTHLDRDPELLIDRSLPYPWVGVRLKPL